MFCAKLELLPCLFKGQKPFVPKSDPSVISHQMTDASPSVNLIALASAATPAAFHRRDRAGPALHSTKGSDMAGKTSKKKTVAAKAKKATKAAEAGQRAKTVDSKIKPAAPKAYASVAVKDSRNGKNFELPILKGTVGPDVVDIRKLYGERGLFTYDPGYGSTGSTQSAHHLYRRRRRRSDPSRLQDRRPAENSDFMEVCYLLLEGELPTAKQKTEFEKNITYHTMLHEQIARFLSGFRRDAHPMAVMVGVVGALSAFYHDSTDIHDPRQRMIASHRLIAKVPTIAAMAYKYSDRPALRVSEERSVLRRELPAHDLCGPGRGVQDRSRRRRGHGQDLHPATPITSRTPRPRPSAWPVRRAPIRLPASRPASPACGARPMAAPTKQC